MGYGLPVEVPDDVSTVEDPEALKAEMVAAIRALQTQAKRALALRREAKARKRELTARLEDMESLGLIKWPSEIKRLDDPPSY
jgi:hypothetical protein